MLGCCIQSIVQLTFGRKAEPLAVLFCYGSLAFPHVCPYRHTCTEGGRLLRLFGTQYYSHSSAFGHLPKMLQNSAGELENSREGAKLQWLSFVYCTEFCSGLGRFGNSPLHHCPVEIVWQTDCDFCDDIRYKFDFNIIWQIPECTIRFQLFIFSRILNDSEGILLLAGTIYIKNKRPLYFILSQLGSNVSLYALKCVLKYVYWPHCGFLTFIYVLGAVRLLSDESKLNRMLKVRYGQQMMPYLHGCRGIAFCRGAWTGFDGLGRCRKLKTTQALICKKYFRSRQESAVLS